ncbi:hypothetical protein LCGC14_2730540 [marine sediment metagenome]|uniref:Uncharacterized protein n=1 Tax=marine sediment metagenome TaxID=412755 RepID=A0A0F8Z7H9_9ZZZZ
MVDLNQNKGVYPREKDKALNDAADKRDMIAKWTAANIPDIVLGRETKVVNPELLKEREFLRNKVGNLAGDLLERDDKIKKLKKDIKIWKQLEQQIIEVQTENSNIKDKLADALNAEQEAKKDLEQLNINIDKAQADKEDEAKAHLEMEVIEAKKSKLQAELDKLA